MDVERHELQVRCEILSLVVGGFLSAREHLEPDLVQSLEGLLDRLASIENSIESLSPDDLARLSEVVTTLTDEFAKLEAELSPRANPERIVQMYQGREASRLPGIFRVRDYQSALRFLEEANSKAVKAHQRMLKAQDRAEAEAGSWPLRRTWFEHRAEVAAEEFNYLRDRATLADRFLALAVDRLVANPDAEPSPEIAEAARRVTQSVIDAKKARSGERM